MLKQTKTIPKIIENYLNYLIAIKGCSINTVKAFSSDLIQFFNFIEKYKEIPIPVNDFNIFVLIQIKEKDIIAFLVYLNYNRDNSPYTRQRKVTALKSFYRWLFSIHPAIKTENPTLALDSIKKVERLPKHLNLDQAKKIQKIFNLSNTRFPKRNNAIITLFLSTGIRISELISINLEDISFDNNSIVVFGKNSRERTVYFNNYCKNILLDYINERICNNENLTFDTPLFTNKYRNRIGVDAVESICKKAYQLIGLDDFGYTAHTLRHTAATIIYTYVTDDILLIKEFLGHVSLASTEIYTHVNNNKVRELVEKNPLSNYKREGSR